ncbi:hypothetical protein B0T10DRAFT_465954 [Thelonectria olida]|uniref:Transcription factor domain-containing protein n=1 Tax=Thelonectria olida TaxID=1576542 RepID=A0A9P8VS80_9HYPO|nr:hypothetical protein B0T10DRAFT_465954 [Thelonectria olida]
MPLAQPLIQHIVRRHVVSTAIEDSADPETPARVHIFREQTFHCLILSPYTRGGDYVLETMINYLVRESFVSEDAKIGHSLVQDIIVQLALSEGYHRDLQHLSRISPFADEMQRRLWAVIVLIDLRLLS